MAVAMPDRGRARPARRRRRPRPRRRGGADGAGPAAPRCRARREQRAIDQARASLTTARRGAATAPWLRPPRRDEGDEREQAQVESHRPPVDARSRARWWRRPPRAGAAGSAGPRPARRRAPATAARGDRAIAEQRRAVRPSANSEQNAAAHADRESSSAAADRRPARRATRTSPPAPRRSAPPAPGSHRAPAEPSWSRSMSMRWATAGARREAGQDRAIHDAASASASGPRVSRLRRSAASTAASRAREAPAWPRPQLAWPARGVGKSSRPSSANGAANGSTHTASPSLADGARSFRPSGWPSDARHCGHGANGSAGGMSSRVAPAGAGTSHSSTPGAESADEPIWMSERGPISM